LTIFRRLFRAVRRGSRPARGPSSRDLRCEYTHPAIWRKSSVARMCVVTFAATHIGVRRIALPWFVVPRFTMHDWWKHLAAALAIFYGVQKLFVNVEEKLSDDTKFEIALWLVDVNALRRTTNWPSNFAQLFDRVFGHRHLTIKCFARSALISLVLFLLSWLWIVTVMRHSLKLEEALATTLYMMMWGMAVTVVPDYVSLLETRAVLHVMTKTNRVGYWAVLLLLDFVTTAFIAALATGYGVGLAFCLVFAKWDLLHAIAMLTRGSSPALAVFNDVFFSPFFYIAFATSVWLWLYVAAGLLVKFAARFDRTLAWLSRRCDIERKPLQVLGLAAGGIAVLVYGTAVVVSYTVLPSWIRLDWLILRWPELPPKGY